MNILCMWIFMAYQARGMEWNDYAISEQWNDYAIIKRSIEILG